MITLYQLPPAFDLPVSVSPYCTKVEAYLRLTGRAYETAKGDVRRSPNRRVPYVAGVEGEALLADSGAILAHLEAEGPALDAGLSEAEVQKTEELQALIQRDIYFACLYARFVDPAGWVHQKPTVKALVPWILAPILVPIIRRSQVTACAEHGFTNAADYTRAVTAIERVSNELGDQRFLLGDAPHVVDCTAWANLMHTAHTLASSPAREAVRADHRLMAYLDRVTTRLELTLPPLR